MAYKMKDNTVFFLSNIFPADYTRGVTKKVFGQIKGFEENGYEVVFYTGYTDDGAAVFDREGNIVYRKKYITQIKLLQRITRNQILKQAAKEFMKKSGRKFSVCYARYLFSDPAFIGFLKTAKKHCDSVWIEAHSYPIYMKSMPQLYPVYFVDFIWNRFIRKYADYIISIAEGYEKIWGVKAIHIDNGIDLESIRIKKNTKSDSIRLVAVAYEWAPHGYDRIVRGLRNYYDGEWSEYVSLKLVGTVLESTRRLISELNLERDIQIAGKKYGDELDEIYDNSDIGVGALATFRAGIYGIACELKTREYIAKGLPFLCTGPAEDKEWYYCVFPQNNDPVDVNKIVEFYKNISNISDYNKKIRNEAESMTWTVQFKKVFEVINNE